jgi:hypothetical protein
MQRALGLSVFLLAAGALAAKSYSGPAKPTIPADTGAIDTSMASCMKVTNDAMPGNDDEIRDDATRLCKLRNEHKAARERLLTGLAKLVSEYRDDTNHEHAQRLPDTIKAIQGIVRNCVDALSSQQYCHNLGCNEEPETNFILCETKAAEILEAIYK